MRRTAAVALLSLPAAQATYAWLVRRLFMRNLRNLRAGNPEPLFKSYADDVRFVFPGDSSWGGEVRGREALEHWVRRFVRVGLQLEPQKILITGPPWKTTFCLLYTDELTTPSGERVYENRGAIYGTIRWGKITSYETAEDTHKVEAFDEWLAEHEQELSASSAAA
ncbi:MAG TPA: nuclear transport factor 2 family protein [Thermoleophilaceae bacterium]